ncbi:hypothetical protein SKAU_G00159290 [Synaphobranchus kaupii]|uniref:Uncharacterized protein n=1 Tax=Synaphobranchus kaupii TaxID=118154 RepID=A0A9Q1FI70_SYNKA|nr:hypothetical protein SKAU_G00159290 [Synaphobranchus kaupii]
MGAGTYGWHVQKQMEQPQICVLLESGRTGGREWQTVCHERIHRGQRSGQDKLRRGRGGRPKCVWKQRSVVTVYPTEVMGRRGPLCLRMSPEPQTKRG